MPTKPTPEQIAYWHRRVAELEAELDAAKRLSDVRVIAGELRRTREALARARERPPDRAGKRIGRP